MTVFDGPTLRAVRESMGVPLRRIARQTGMSHGHLSKVERGEYGRPVTPAILAAYQRATGVNMDQAAAAVAERIEGPTARRVKSWRPGELTDMRRRAYNAAMAALAIGGQLGEPFGRLLDSAGRPLTPAPPDLGDIAQLEQLTEVVTELELRFGGGLISQLAKQLLRWTAPMLDSISMGDKDSRRLHAVIGALAARAGWAAFDVAAHEAARCLFRLALYTSARSGDPSLRAHVLADTAAQHNHLGYHEDCLQIVRLAEGDERVDPAVRMVLHSVKARGYAAIGEAAACRQHVDLAEQAYSAADAKAPGWVGTLCHEGHLYAGTGHAMAQLARRSEDQADLLDAQQRLVKAVDAFDPTTHARTRTLCVSKLAALHLNNGELDHAAAWAHQVLAAMETIRSSRLDRGLASIRAAAVSHPDEPVMSDLLAAIDAAAEAG